MQRPPDNSLLRRPATGPAPFALPGPLQRRVEARIRSLVQPPGETAIDFASPAGEPGLIAPDSVSWQVFKNPLSMFVGGVAAVVLELAEPRVRTGVWEHTRFREEPLQRMQRTALSAMLTVYGPRSRAEVNIAGVTRLHSRVQGETPAGQPYRALDPELLTWVHATASFGFMEAYARYVRTLSEEERDRYYSEGLAAARLYGARFAPGSQAGMGQLLDTMLPKLEPSPIVLEFLTITSRMPALPLAFRPLQPLLVRAAVEVVPAEVRQRLGLGPRQGLSPLQHTLVKRLARGVDRWLLASCPPVQACRRLGLPDDHLYRASPR